MLRKACFALILAACACTDHNPLSPAELNALAAAEAKWTARPFADYQYEMIQLCFCPTELNRWTRVSVRNGHVVAAQAVETDSIIPVERLSMWQPIDSLFSRLRSAAGDPSVREIYSDILVEFDPTLGFPTRVEWKENPGIADAAMTYQLRNVQRLE